MEKLVAAPASAKHQFLSDISDYRNHTLYSIGRLASRGTEGFGMCGQVAERQLRQTVDLLGNLRGFKSLPTHQTIEELRKSANGTSNMAGAIDKAVAAAAPSRVRVPRPANPPWTDVQGLP